MLSNLAMSLVKVLGSFIAGIGSGFLAVGIFALRNPERWEFAQINRHGPPFGPTVLAVGVGMLTTMLLLVLLFWRSWRRRALEGSLWRGALVKVLASLVGGAGTGMVILGAFAMKDQEHWEFNGPANPPMGPILLALGVGFLTAALLLAILFSCSGRKRPDVIAVSDPQPQ